MTESDDESRANRLRDRRRRSRSRGQQEEREPAENETDESFEADKPSQSSKTSKPSQPSKPEGGEGGGVKDTQVGTYMYLPESVRDDLAYQFKIQSAEYEREFGEEMEKNRHWYPLVINLGLEQVEGMESEEIHERLQQETGGSND